MKLRRAGACADCSIEIGKGTEAFWFSAEKAVRCVGCVAEPGAEHPVMALATTAAAHSGEPVVSSEENVAGASAQREYERRSERSRRKQEKAVAADAEWRRELIERRPVVGRISAALTPKPEVNEAQHTTAWRVGAEGERRVAEVLEPVPGIEILHDRQVPDSKANLDHLVVAPSGVFVIDAKKYTGGIEVRDVGTMFKADHRLYVKGRDRTKLVDSMLWQRDVVRSALGVEFADVEVHGSLCFIGVEWGWRKRPKSLKGVVSIWPLALPEHVSAPGPHADRISEIAAHLRAALPPA